MEIDSLISDHVFESISDSLIIIIENGEVIHANRITKDVLGYDQEELRQQGLGPLLFVREENDEFNQIVVDAIWNKHIKKYQEVDYHHPDGSLRRLGVTTSYLLGDSGASDSFIGFVILSKDITETFVLRQREQELIQQRQRLALEQVKTLQGLALGVAHEIRNRTVTIGGFASRLRSGKVSALEQEKFLDGILNDVHKLETVVKSVEECCNLPQMNRIPGNIGYVVEQAISKMAITAKSKRISIEFDNSQPKELVITFDQALLKTAIGKVLENAIEFSREGSSIDVALYPIPEGIMLEIKDHGMGISAEDRELIFSPFFSTRPDRPGLGLVLVDSVIRQHGGRVEVESEKDSGTIVRLILQ